MPFLGKHSVLVMFPLHFQNITAQGSCPVIFYRFDFRTSKHFLFAFSRKGWFKCLSSFVQFAGTSLLQEVVYLVSQGADPDEIGLMNIDEQLPVLEYPQPGLDIIKVQLNP